MLVLNDENFCIFAKKIQNHNFSYDNLINKRKNEI